MRNAIQEIQDAIDSTGVNRLVKYLTSNQEDLDEHSAWTPGWTSTGLDAEIIFFYYLKVGLVLFTR